MAVFPVGITHYDLDQWEKALEELAGDRFVSWLKSGRTVRLGIKPSASGAVGVSLQDAPSSQVTVSLPLSPAAGWIEDRRACLDHARRTFVG
ncbi:DUF5959 family protein [Kitasatospora sp. NPDC096077]|uniref:DUF5959 family protein n=1 Tax=Kitasatospora sp. NPDC096077 TaxID=3155544 RepID=UPI003331E10E